MTSAGRAAAGLLAACALAVAAAGCGDPAPPPGATPSPGTGTATPRIEVEPRAFDFGRVLPGKTLSKEIAVRNHGGADLVISKVATTCNCTVVGSYARVVAPGGGTTLRVSLTTPETPGRTFQGVRIESNDPEQPKVDVDVEATVVAAPAAR